MGLTLTTDLYDKIYSGEVDNYGSVEDTLNFLFIRFNTGKKPKDFTGQKISLLQI